MHRILAFTALLLFSSQSAFADTAQQILHQTNTTGGFVVHVGCGDGTLTAALKQNDATLVHGLDTDPDNVRRARATLLATNSSGTATVAQFDGEHLPYVDNLVNLLVCTQEYNVTDNEILRVLCPGGTAITPTGSTISKPRPDAYDEWTHYLHNADNNAVSQDTAIDAPIQHLQWSGSPKYSRHHDKSSSLHAAVTTGGRLFYIMDEGPRASVLWAPKWQLVARDAFNGVVLWRKDIEQWTSHLWGLKSGPSNTPRRLVAVDDSVYVTLGLMSPVSRLDAQSGRVEQTYVGTEMAEEILFADGVLYLAINPDIDPAKRGGRWEKSARTLMAVNASDGTILWQQQLPWIAPCTLTVGANQVYACDGPRIVAFDRPTGNPLWQSEPLPGREEMPTYFAPTLVAVPGAVLYAGGEDWREHAGSMGLTTCLDAETGQIRWQAPNLPSGYQSPQDLFVIDGAVWSGSLNSKPGEFDIKYPDVSPSTGLFEGYDLETGRLVGSIPRDVDCYWFHHRCHRARATENFFLTSRTGIEMIDIDSGKWSLHHWVRGACVYGIMPANGLIYAPPHPCACYPEAKLSGFNAVSGPRAGGDVSALRATPRLVKGPAYSEISAGVSSTGSPDAWPTFRGSAARNGSNDVAISTKLGTRWKTQLGGRLSQPVAAGGMLFVAAVDDHTVYALDQKSGALVWQFTAGGRIDSPPTIHNGSAVFGSADGYAYCVRVSDGVLAWRFRAAPHDQRLMSEEQLESVWPVHGSVLIENDTAYVLAGRSMFLDGGLTLYLLDPATGEVRSSEQMTGDDPNTGGDLHEHVTMLSMPVASSDILSCDRGQVFMRSQPLDLSGKRDRVAHANLKEQRGDESHLFAPNGFLDDNWWHRSFWVYGRSVQGGPSYYETGNATPSGKMMVLDDEDLYVFGREQSYWKWTTSTEYRLFSVNRTLPKTPEPDPPLKAKQRANPKVRTPQFATRWNTPMPVLVRAMVKAGDTLFIAGPEDTVNEDEAFKAYDKPGTQEDLARQAELFEGADGSLLWAVSAEDGSKRAEIKLDVLPVFDGMIAADGDLLMATVDGQVVCLGAE